MANKSNKERLKALNEEVRNLDMQAHWWGLQMLRPGEVTRRHRHTGTTQHHVARGSGVTIVDEATTPPPGQDPQEPVLSAEAAALE